MTNIKPVSGYVLIKPIVIETTNPSGIILPNSNRNKPQEGEVLATGGTLNNGTLCPCEIGDIVIYREWGGKEYKENNVDLLILKFEDIIAIKQNE